VVRVAPGGGVLDRLMREPDEPHYGVLILEGLLTRHLWLGPRTRALPFGPGDVLRPWTAQTMVSSIAAEAEWRPHAGLYVAVLDGALVTRAAAYPHIGCALMERSSACLDGLALLVAIADLPSLTDRLHRLFWHLGDRWGRITPGGLRVSLRLTHDLLGQMVGARRPGVCMALRRLAADGTVTRLPGGGYLVRGVPPAELSRQQCHAPRRTAMVTA
jgi:hypothetical protein